MKKILSHIQEIKKGKVIAFFVVFGLLIMHMYYNYSTIDLNYDFAWSLFTIFLVVLFFGMLGLYLLFFVIKDIKIHVLVLVTILFIGYLYSIVIIPNGVPDEHLHYNIANQKVYNLLGITELDPLDQNDVVLVGNTINAYRNIYDNIHGNAPEVSRNMERATAPAPNALYIFSGAGLLFGRILNLSNVSAFYLGRFLNLLFFALCSYFGVKWIPFGKMALSSVCLFPMTIHLAASFSQDGVVLGLIILYISKILQIKYEKNMMSVLDLILLLVVGTVFISSKGGTYLPLGFLLFIIPKEKYRDKRFRFIAYGTFIFVTTTYYVFQMLTTVRENIGENIVVWSGTPSTTLGQIISNPINSISILYHTIWISIDNWVNGIFGASLGWFNINIRSTVIIAFMVIFLLTLVNKEDSLYIVKTKTKIFTLIIITLCFGMITLGMWLAWTPYDSILIEGIQGRYFLPFMLLIPVLAYNKNLIIKNTIERQLLYSIVVLHYYSLFLIIREQLQL